MRNFIIGFVVGMTLSGGIAYAAVAATLQNGSGIEIGTPENPLYIQSV